MNAHKAIGYHFYEMTIRPIQLHHVSRQTQKLEETRKFYCEVLGSKNLAAELQFPRSLALRIRHPDALNPGTLFSNPAEISSRENHIAFKVADMEAAEEVLKHHGIVYKHNVVPDRGTNQLFFRDPEGWMIELGPYPAAIDQ